MNAVIALLLVFGGTAAAVSIFVLVMAFSVIASLVGDACSGIDRKKSGVIDE